MNSDSTFGRYLKISLRGASHAKKMIFALENFPAGFHIDENALKELMDRRAPGRDLLSTQRKEPDEVVFTSGVKKGVTTGGTICGQIASVDMRPADYGSERTIPRPGHADFGQWVQYGRIPTGGGKNSGRLTATLCAAGGICKQWLEQRGVYIRATIESLGGVRDGSEKDYEQVILKARKAGDSVGGEIECGIIGLPAGLGGPLFEGLETGISAAIFGIPGVKGISFGMRPDLMCAMRGSQYNDAFAVRGGQVGTSSIRQGGILGGRTAGTLVCFTVAMRPTPTVFKAQASVDLSTMRPADCVMRGRHDPCIVRRALPVVEAVTAFAIADAILADEAARPRICLTLTGKTLVEDLEQYKSQRYFTDMVELRVDLLRKSERAKVPQFPVMLGDCNGNMWQTPIILTFRKKCDGGAFEGSEEERAKFFKKVLSSGAPFANVDFEEGFGDASLVAQAHAAGVKVVRSVHDFTGPVKNLPARLKRLAADGDIAKIAFMPKTKKDVDRLFTQLAGKDIPPHVVCAMGPLGLPSRVLAGRLGSLWTYASVGGLGKIGHLTPYDLVRDYRFRSVSKNAKVVYVPAGDVARVNAAFLAEDEDAVALPAQ